MIVMSCVKIHWESSNSGHHSAHPTRQDRSTVDQDTPPTQQENSTVDQDTPPTQQDSSTVDQETPPTQHDIIDTTQITSRQRRGRRNISQVCAPVASTSD